VNGGAWSPTIVAELRQHIDHDGERRLGVDRTSPVYAVIFDAPVEWVVGHMADRDSVKVNVNYNRVGSFAFKFCNEIRPIVNHIVEFDIGTEIFCTVGEMFGKASFTSKSWIMRLQRVHTRYLNEFRYSVHK
jgi:hypothetical protein